MLPGSKGGRRGSVVAAGLLGFCLATAPGAWAADDGYANVFSSVLGSVGLIKGDAAPDIQYRERPPLVLPKDAALPKPVVGREHSAAWPQDPDVVKKRKEQAEAHAPHTLDRANGEHVAPLTPEEQLKGRVAATDSGDEPVRPNCGKDGNLCTKVGPAELQREFDAYHATNPDKGDTVVAGQEPAREYLTQPPKGYLKATRTVKATSEAPEEKIDEASPRYAKQQELKHREEVEQ